MASPVVFPSDDKDLDDAALWAVIDSAAASHSSKTPKTLSIKYPVPDIPSPISDASPPAHRITKNPRLQYSFRNDRVASSNGEVLQTDHRQRKAARSSISEIGVSSPPALAVVKHVQRMPTTPAISSPEADKFLTKGHEISPFSGRVSDEKPNDRHSLSGPFPSVSLFRQYQSAAMAILENTDYAMISGNPVIKKSGWRKISFYFNLSYEIKDKSIEFDGDRNVQRAEFVVRAHMQSGRFSDGWGSCERREKRFLKPNRDVPSTAETRAKNRACQDLLGIGEYRPCASHGFH